MAWESIQGTLYLITSVLAALAAVLGAVIINKLFGDNHLKELFSNTKLFIFSCLVFGYVCFALAELNWFLIFKVFGKTSSASMPDFYWVVGSFFSLIAFAAFFGHMYQRHGKPHHLGAMSIFAVIVLGSVLLFQYGLDLTASSTAGILFLGYFYPVASSIILISSLSVYLFFEKIDRFRNTFLFIFLANFAFLSGDLAYTYITKKGIYGPVGAFSDFSYIFAYLLVSFAFLYLLTGVSEAEL